jgi:hypothetical protein
MKKIFIILALLVSAGLFGGGYMYGNYRTSQAMMSNYLVGDRYTIVRTVGGMLEVSTLKKQESFSWKTSWTCPANACQSLPASMSTVSGVANYTYRIALADHWVLEKKTPTTYVLKVPRLEVKTPVAVDLTTIRVHGSGGLFAPAGPSQSAMQTYMQPMVNERGASPDYVALQKEVASKTVTEFAQKWLRDGDVKLPDGATIEVVFSK